MIYRIFPPVHTLRVGLFDQACMRSIQRNMQAWSHLTAAEKLQPRGKMSSLPRAQHCQFRIAALFTCDKCWRGGGAAHRRAVPQLPTSLGWDPSL